MGSIRWVRRLAVAVICAGLMVMVTGCQSSSDVASQNLSTQADNYQVFRQIVVYNGITDKYILEVDGYCSLGNHDNPGEVTYTCKTSQGYIKDIIEKSDNTFLFVHQLHPLHVSQDYFKVILKPTTIIPQYGFSVGQ